MGTAIQAVKRVESMKRKKVSPSMEDHLEVIYWLVEEKGEARPSEISSFLGHKLPSVTEMLEKLSREGLIKHEKYGAVLLTPRGRRIAKEVSSRHVDLISFLEILGVDRKTAEIDACKIEHVVNPKTMKRLRKLVEFAQEHCIKCLRKGVASKPEWLKHYKYFVETGKRLKCEFRESAERSESLFPSKLSKHDSS